MKLLFACKKKRNGNPEKGRNQIKPNQTHLMVFEIHPFFFFWKRREMKKKTRVLYYDMFNIVFRSKIRRDGGYGGIRIRTEEIYFF